MAKSIDDIRRDVYGKPCTSLVRSLAIDRDQDIDVDTRTVKLAFASDKPIDNWWYGQIRLMMGKKNVRTERFRQRRRVACFSTTRINRSASLRNIRSTATALPAAPSAFQNPPLPKRSFRTSATASEKCQRRFHDLGAQPRNEIKRRPSIYRADDWEPYEVSIVSRARRHQRRRRPRARHGQRQDPAADERSGNMSRLRNADGRVRMHDTWVTKKF
jgi:hypothetical protein